MAETAPTTTVTTATPPPAPFAPGAGTAAASHAAAAEKARAAFATERAAAPATPAAPSATPAPGIETQGLADLTRLSADKRRLEGEIAARDARIKQLEPHEADAQMLVKVRDLYKSGKRVEAIGMLAGADPTGEMEALLTDYLKPDATPETGDKLAAKVDEVAKRIEEAADKAKASEAEAVQAKQAAAGVIGAIKAQAAKLPHLSKAEESEATGKVLSAFTRLRFEKGFNDHTTMTPGDVQGLLDEALSEADIEYEVRAVRAGKATPAAVTQAAQVSTVDSSAPVASLDAIEKPGIAEMAWGKTLTHKAAREKLAAALLAGKK